MKDPYVYTHWVPVIRFFVRDDRLFSYARLYRSAIENENYETYADISRRKSFIFKNACSNAFDAIMFLFVTQYVLYSVDRSAA